MPIVNYVREFERFVEYASDEKLTGGEMLLWWALMHIMNQRAQGNVWPEEFVRIANDRILTFVPMRFDAMAQARNGLKTKGLIDYIPGKKNKESPAYRMIYFYPQYVPPETEQNTGYNTEKSDNVRGNIGDNIGGNLRGNMGGNIRDIYINNTDKHRHIPNQSGEEDNTTTVGNARARERRYPERTRPLTEAEENTYNRVILWMMGNYAIQNMYRGEGWDIALELLSSDRYPLELVGYAIEKTLERNEKYETPLGNAIAYTEKLLSDWDERGFSTIEDVKRSKDDYS